MITIDQALAGGSNVFTAVLAARALGVAAFGLFGIVFLVYVLVQGVSRALVCDPLLLHPADAEGRPGAALGTSVVLGCGLGAVVLLASVLARVWDARLGAALLVFGVCVPLLLLQDLGRYLGFARQRPGNAVALDTCWLVLVVGAVAALFAFDARTLTWFVLAWAGAGAVSGLLTFWLYRGDRVTVGLAWLRHTWWFSWRYLISYSAVQGAALAGSSVIGGVAGARPLGGVQGASLLARPFATFQFAVSAAGVADIARIEEAAADRGARARRHAVRFSALTSAAALLNGGVMIALPDAIGEQVLGATWHTAKPLLLATAVQLLLLGALAGPRVGLLGLKAIRRAMVIDVSSGAAVLLASTAGVFVNGALGALWGVAIAQGMLVIIWWAVFLRHTASAGAGPARVGDERVDVLGREPRHGLAHPVGGPVPPADLQ